MPAMTVVARTQPADQQIGEPLVRAVRIERLLLTEVDDRQEQVEGVDGGVEVRRLAGSTAPGGCSPYVTVLAAGQTLAAGKSVQVNVLMHGSARSHARFSFEALLGL